MPHFSIDDVHIIATLLLSFGGIHFDMIKTVMTAIGLGRGSDISMRQYCGASITGLEVY